MEAMNGANQGGEDGEFCSIEYSIVGHSGDSYAIPFVSFPDTKWDEHIVRNTTGMSTAEFRNHFQVMEGNLFPPPKDEAERMNILSKMVAHSQYTLSGDNTLKATEAAIDRMTHDQNMDSSTENYVIVVSDANFSRYNISPERFGEIMTKDARIAPGVHLILLASFDNEAQRIVKKLPVGQGHVCLNTLDLPLVMRDILSNALSR